MTTTDTRLAPLRRANGGILRRAFVSRSVFVDLVRLTDVLIVALSSVFAYGLYNVGVLGEIETWPVATGATLIGILISLNIFSCFKVYDFSRLRDLRYQWIRIAAAWTATLAMFIVLVFLTKTALLISRGWLLIWWSSTLGGLFIARVITQHMIGIWQESGSLRRYVAIIGATDHAARVIGWLREEHGTEISLVGIFDDRHGRAPSEVVGVPVLGTTDDLITFARENSVEQVIIALPVAAETRVMQTITKLRQMPSDIDLSLDLAGSALMAAASKKNPGNLPLLHLIDRPLNDWQTVWKALEDKVIGTLILILVAPLMLLIAAMIALETPGPVIFRQRRHGFNSRHITVYKFRTMHHGMADPSGGQQTVKEDPRITRVGRFLRRTSLDELPQFINVLQGRLSVVGPRPHVPTMKAANRLYHEAVDQYALRHRVKPGITGWAQVNGLRGETDTMEKATKRVDYDLHYIDNWSLWLDLKIIALTIIRGFRDPNAF
ncbi:MAG: undecaprenyl-phosphate glucose phosphotransferase [Alphaproteobacteria bacterium]